jgi:membrane dipeptidase
VDTQADHDAAAVVASTDVWDMTLPWLPAYWDLELLDRYRRAGYTFVSASLTDWPPTFEGTLQSVARFKAMVAELDWLAVGSSLEQIDRGRAEGTMVVGLNTQEAGIIGDDLSRLETLHQLGVRHMLLAYQVRNHIADGCAEMADAGLSNFGRTVVREMNRVGMTVDVSHTGRKSSLEAIDLSGRPVIFSHSNPYAVCAHIRNIHDDQIRACAESGGVVGVVGIGSFLGDAEARTETMFRHVDYIAELVGPEHVGIGTDYIKQYPQDEYSDWWAASDLPDWPDSTYAWPDPTGTQIANGDSRCFAPEQLVELVGQMLARGYSAAVIRGILGGNFRRAYAAAAEGRAVHTSSDQVKQP